MSAVIPLGSEGSNKHVNLVKHGYCIFSIAVWMVYAVFYTVFNGWRSVLYFCLIGHWKGAEVSLILVGLDCNLFKLDSPHNLRWAR